ncbi:MAG: hypothetical protein LCH36_00355 [Actinobacteria bacterium]|nr:hypothetical protein [Actinomycetota bacterium]
MIPLAKHTAHVLTTAGVPVVDPVSVSVSMDESWSPRVQGQVVLHRDHADALPDRLLVRMRATFGSDMSIAAITAWAGGSIAAITARAGGSVKALTDMHTRPWNPFETSRPLSYLSGSMSALTAAYRGDVAKVTDAMRQPGGTYQPPAPQVLEYVLHRRRHDDTHSDDLTTVQLASADIELHDYRRTVPVVYTSEHTTLRALIGYVLDQVDGVLNPGTDTPIEAGATWEPGRTAWEFIQPLLEQTGWQLYADEHGRYTLEPRTVTVAPVTLDADLNLIDWEQATDPAFDSVVIEYTGSDPHTYDVYAPPGSKRPLHETRDTAQAGVGAAEEIALRAGQRARTATADALSLYALRPLHRTTVHVDDTTARMGTVESVSWSWPETTMRASLRDLTTL